MRLFSRIDRLFFGSFVGTIILEALGKFFGDQFPAATEKYVLWIVFVVVAAWVLYTICRALYLFLTAGRYAVEAFILNNENNLLLYSHSFHKKQIPPGGRVGPFEFPHEAIVRRLEERLNLKRDRYEFMPEFHHGLSENSGVLGPVERVPAPYLVQRELHEQRWFVRYHYDFIYVLRLKDVEFNFSQSKYAPVHFVSLDNLRRIVDEHQCYSDVQDAYERILRRLSAGTTAT